MRHMPLSWADQYEYPDESRDPALLFVHLKKEHVSSRLPPGTVESRCTLVFQDNGALMYDALGIPAGDLPAGTTMSEKNGRRPEIGIGDTLVYVPQFYSLESDRSGLCEDANFCIPLRIIRGERSG